MIYEKEYNISDSIYEEMKKNDILSDEERVYMNKKRKESEERDKELDKENELPDGAYFPGMKWTKKMKTRLLIKVVLVVFFFFTPIGQDFLIDIGTVFFRDGSQFIVDTFTDKANEHGVFDYNKPISERVPRMFVIVMVPVILFVYLMIKGIMILVMRSNYKHNRLNSLITDQLEDYDYHQKLKRDAVYKDVYK